MSGADPGRVRSRSRDRDNDDDSARDRLDWPRQGLSAWQRRIAYAAAEALLCDEGEDGRLAAPRQETCDRAVEWLSHSLGRASSDLRGGFVALSLALELLPLFVVGAPARMSRMALERRVAYLEALETSRFGLFSLLILAFKVPLCVPAFEEGEELAATGFDRPSTTARRRLPVSHAPHAPHASTVGAEDAP